MGIRINGPELLTRSEVAIAFGVDGSTVTRWADSHLLPVVKTPGGHRRYPRTAVEALVNLHAQGFGNLIDGTIEIGVEAPPDSAEEAAPADADSPPPETPPVELSHADPADPADADCT